MDKTIKNAEKLLLIAEKLLLSRERVIIALDGRAASGKTTLAAELFKLCDCNVFHTDDFFLRPEQRTAERLSEPGGNVDYERFLDEVLKPLGRGEAISYRRYNCGPQKLSEAEMILPKRLNLVEGAYSCHPTLWNCYDYHIFSDISPKEQMERIALRNPEKVSDYVEKWILLEEKYFLELKISERCELKIV